MTRSLFFLLLMVLPLLPALAGEPPAEPSVDIKAAPANPGDAILGIWATDKAEAHIEISRTEEGTYTATIIWLEEPFYPPDDEGGMAGQPRVDRENPDPELRDRPIEGLLIMRGLEYDGDREWVDGEIYDPETGNTYSSEIWLTDEGTLKVRGYVGFSLFGRTTEWTPILVSESADNVADPASGKSDDDGSMAQDGDNSGGVN